VLELNGGGGGGQLLRTALALSALTGKPFRMTNVRGSRPNPGLKAQHTAALWAVHEVCNADVEGGEHGSETVTFEPGHVTGGELRVEVGTAGSVPLVFDAVLPLGYTLSDPLSLTVGGGTDVRWAPTMTHHAAVKRPLAARFGLRYRDRIERVGFYPAGGGEATLELEPSKPSSATVTERGALVGGTLHATASDDLEQAEVAERMADTVTDVPLDFDREVAYKPADSTGAVCSLVAEFEGSVAGFDALGDPNRSAETVAGDVLAAFAAFREGAAAADEHTADQSMVPLAVAGGAVSIPAVTDHVASNAAVIRAFGGDLRIDESGAVPVLRSEGGF
jgi:RNA 3'-terminal phosphate cyclase (ATP)